MDQKIELNKQFLLNPDIMYTLGFIVKNKGTEVKILNNVTAPQDIDLLGIQHARRTNIPDDYCCTFKVKPVYTGTMQDRVYSILNESED
jgi:hypothetical protein